MSVAVDRALRERLVAAEREMMCLVPLSAAESRALRRRLGSLVVSPHPGMFARLGWWARLTPPQRCVARARALACVHPSWVFAGATAAALHGLDVSYDTLGKIWLVAPRGGRSGVRGALRYVAVRSPCVEVVRGVRATSLMQTLADCLCMLDMPDGLALADSALRTFSLPIDELDRFARCSCRGRRGAGKVRWVLQHADGRAANGGESKARALMLEEGYMKPDLQRRVIDPVEPWRTYYLDFYWELPDGRKVAGELDGRGKTTDQGLMGGRSLRQVEVDERRRESRSTALGIQIMRFPSSILADRMALRRLLDAFGIPRVGPALGAAANGDGVKS